MNLGKIYPLHLKSWCEWVSDSLLAQHRTERDRRRADRIKAVLLRDDGWSYEQIAAALFLSDEGVRRQIEDYLKNGKLKPENGGSMARLLLP
jgi:predicted ArsR family transcriptional regulator